MPSSSLPGRSVRLAATLLLVAYFAAVLAAVTGAGSGRFSPPLISAEASTWVRPVLQPLNLDNSHRYYAPNPGAEATLWLRLVYADSTVRWLEWPCAQPSVVGLQPYAQPACAGCVEFATRIRRLAAKWH